MRPAAPTSSFTPVVAWIPLRQNSAAAISTMRYGASWRECDTVFGQRRDGSRTRCMATGDSPPRAGGIGSALFERPGSIADTSRTAISLPLTSKIGAPEQLKSLSSERHSEAVVPIFIDRGARIKRRHGPERPRYSLPPTRLSASPVQETNGGAVEGADGPHVSWITANSDLSISSRKLPVWCRCTRT